MADLQGPVAKPRAQTMGMAVPEEGYTSMSSTTGMAAKSSGYLRPVDYMEMSGNITLGNKRAASSSTSLADNRATVTSFTGSSASSQQNVSQHPGSTLTLQTTVSDMSLARHRTVTSDTDLSSAGASAVSPQDPSPYRIGTGQDPEERRYENSQTANQPVPHRYIPPSPEKPTTRTATTSNGRAGTPEAPYYGETTNQYSVIGPRKSDSTRRVDSVLYGNRTDKRRRRRQKSESSLGADDGSICGSRSLLIGILLILALLCVASLGLSIYLLVSREDCNCAPTATNSG